MMLRLLRVLNLDLKTGNVSADRLNKQSEASAYLEVICI